MKKNKRDLENTGRLQELEGPKFEENFQKVQKV